MQFIDRVFLAQYSSVAIQAALPSGLLAFTLCSAFMALAGYANTFVAHYYGSGERVGCARATAQGIWASLASWPLILALIPVGRSILRGAGHPADVLEQELTYFTILMLGGVNIPLGAAISSFFTGRGDTLTNMYAQLAGNAVNIALDYALIFGRWGFPELGIRGAAIGTVIAGFVPPLILGAIYLTPRLHAEYATRSTWRFDRALFARLLRFGTPSGLHLFLDVASFSVFVLLTGRLGALSLAVSNIALSINTLAFMPLLGISIAASTLVGQYQGRREPDKAERAGWTSLKVGLIYMGFMAVTYLAFPKWYFLLFSERGGGGFSLEELLSVGRWLLVLMAIWGLLDTINLVLSGALKGAGDTRFVMWYSIAMAWGFFVPGSWLVIEVWKGGIIEAWAFLAFVIMALSIGFWLRFKRGRWKQIEVIDRQTPLPPVNVGQEGRMISD
jgi:MATE family multidrug resistance protein